MIEEFGLNIHLVLGGLQPPGTPLKVRKRPR
jgi:hypothetical protein